MYRIDPDLRQDYERWMQQIADLPLHPGCVVTADDVMRAHYLLVDRFKSEAQPIGIPGPRDINLLMSALGRQTTGYGGRLKYQSDFEVCATLFYGLIKDHPFHDGNKRTALLTALYHLQRIGRTPKSQQKEFEKLALRTAADELHLYSQYEKHRNKNDAEVLFIAHFLRRNTRELDSSLRLITYRDLDKILRRYGYYLDDPGDNHIHVAETVTERHGLLLRQRTREKVVLRIGFPRWSAQVPKSVMSSVLDATGLTERNGYDSKTVFEGADPLDALLDEYYGLLKRLRDK